MLYYAGTPIYAKSSKQALVTKSSTEAELVSLSDGVTVLLASRNFLIGLMVELEPSIVYEDNKAVLELI